MVVVAPEVTPLAVIVWAPGAPAKATEGMVAAQLNAPDESAFAMQSLTLEGLPRPVL